MNTFPRKISLQNTDFSLCITLSLNQTVKHIHSWLQLIPSITYPPFVLSTGINQNPWWYTRDYTKLLTQVSRYRPISSKRPISYLQQKCLISFNICFNHSSSFNFLTISFGIFFARDPTLLRSLRVGIIHPFYISIQLLLDLIYSPPISNWPWCHQVRQLLQVVFLID